MPTTQPNIIPQSIISTSEKQKLTFTTCERTNSHNIFYFVSWCLYFQRIFVCDVYLYKKKSMSLLLKFPEEEMGMKFYLRRHINNPNMRLSEYEIIFGKCPKWKNVKILSNEENAMSVSRDETPNRKRRKSTFKFFENFRASEKWSFQ